MFIFVKFSNKCKEIKAIFWTVHMNNGGRKSDLPAPNIFLIKSFEYNIIVSKG